MTDEIEAFLKNIQEGWEACDPDGEVDFHVPELLSLVRVYREQNDTILDHCRRKGYPTGTEWIVLADTARAAESKAKEIVGR